VQDDVEAAYTQSVSELRRMISDLSEPVPVDMYFANAAEADLEVESNTSPEEFRAMVLKAKEYIRSGDIIQTVLSQRFKAHVQVDPLSVYRVIRSINPSPYMFNLEFGGRCMVGASPEIHVRLEDGVAEVRPIAGTRPRGLDAEEDQRLADELLADPKERAEHIMLVDLGRNDLGRVCEYGSVHVPELMVIEKYSHVMHIVSDVVGRIKPDKNAYDLLRATFPAGTLSGAPKIRAMEIISELEPSRRGAYGGAVAYVGFDGTLDSCITIRTLLLDGNEAYVQAGAGIVADSDPESEYLETCNKARGMLKALAIAQNHERGGGDTWA
jgi:anthranilate synthase component 1